MVVYGSRCLLGAKRLVHNPFESEFNWEDPNFRKVSDRLSITSQIYTI